MVNTLEYQDILKLVQKHYPNLAEPALQEEIAQNGQILRFRAGDVMLDFGNYVKIMPLVVDGVIKVMMEGDDGRELFLYYLQSGASCTMTFTCCLMHKKSIVKTIAEEDITIIALPVRLMDAWMTKYQSWKNFVLKSYDDRMMELIRTLESVAFKQMDQRLLDYLRNKTLTTGSKTMSITHQEIADDLSASREAISRLLKQLERDGVLSLGRNRITMK